MYDCIIQAVFFFHCSVTQLVLQFCPNCHIHSYVFLISRREITIFMLFTYIRNCRILFYCYTLFVSDFKNKKAMSLLRVMCISFHGQSMTKVLPFYKNYHLNLTSAIFFSRKALKLLTGIFLLCNHCSSSLSHFSLHPYPAPRL